MKFIAAILSFTFSLLGVASNSVQMDIELEYNGEKSKPAIIANYGEEAAITTIENSTNSGWEIKVRPEKIKNTADHAHKEVKMSFEIFKVRNRKATLISSPRVESVLGKTAEIQQELKGGFFSLKVTPRKVNGVPIIKNGKIQGYKTNKINSGSKFEKLGIKSGDIIAEVNGKKMNSLAVTQKMYTLIDRSQSITVKRGDKNIKLVGDSGNSSYRSLWALIGEENKDPNILTQISLVPVKGSENLFKVAQVEKGSIFEKKGVQVGEILRE